ncbi:MAG: hypothetical protein ACI3WT_03555 [Phascolarctobacterium sp.]
MKYDKLPKEQLESLLCYSENAFLELIELAEDAKAKAENEYERRYQSGRIRAYQHALKIVRGND